MSESKVNTVEQLEQLISQRVLSRDHGSIDAQDGRVSPAQDLPTAPGFFLRDLARALVC